MSLANPVTCLFHFFETLNDTFEVQFFIASCLHVIEDTGIACIRTYHAAQIF